MIEHVEQLIKTLRSMAKLHRSLLEAVVKKRAALVAWNIPELNEWTAAEEKACESIRLLDTERQRAVIAIRRLHWRKPTPLKLKDIIEMAPTPQLQEQLKQARVELNTVIREIAQANQVNVSLCNQSLEHIGFVLRVLQGGEGGAAYTMRGKHADNRPQMRLDTVA